MKLFLTTFSYAAFCFFVLGCLLELVALLGFNSFALFGTAGGAGSWMAFFLIAFFVFWLPMFVLQFVPPYREAIREAAAFRITWATWLVAAGFVGWITGIIWMNVYWGDGSPEIHDGRYVLWLKRSNQYLPLSASEYQHDMAIFARIMMAWVIAVFLGVWWYYKRTAELLADRRM